MTKPQLELAGIDNDSCTRLNSGSTMQDGVVTIPKQLYFKVPNGQDPRQYNDLDVYSHPLFPQKYSALSADPRFKFYGNARVRHDLDNGHYFTAELEYSSENPNATDDEGNPVTSETKPWKLRPDNIEFTYPEMNVKFEASYDSKGKLYNKKYDATEGMVYEPVMPVVNSAGDPFPLERTVRNIQMSFMFAVQKWEISHAIHFGNTINSNEITVVGLTIPAGCALLLPPECTYITVYKDNSSAVKWQYWNVKIIIQIDMIGLLLNRKVLNIGDRALFPAISSYTDDLIDFPLPIPASNSPAQICKFRKYKKINLTGGKFNFSQSGDIQYCSWDQFIAFRQEAISCSAALKNLSASGYTGGIVDPQCEQLSKMPLVAYGTNKGQLDTAAITSGKYSSLTFREYPYKDWKSLNLPKKGIKW